MEAGDYDRAVELYEAAKERRAAAQARGPTLARAAKEFTASAGSDAYSLDDLGSSQRGSLRKPLPQHGRRSGERIGVALATPSRRVCPEGAPSRKEEVAARVAARK